MDRICFTTYACFVQCYGHRVFLGLCKQIFFEGRSENVQQFFERRYNISFPIDITCYYYKDVVTRFDYTDEIYIDIHKCLSKKIEELMVSSSSYDFLLMSNICRVLWSNGIKKPEEEKIKELMKKLMYEINVVECGGGMDIKKITLSNLSDKLEEFHTLIEHIEEEVNRSMVHKREIFKNFIEIIEEDVKNSSVHSHIDFDHLKKEIRMHSHIDFDHIKKEMRSYIQEHDENYMNRYKAFADMYRHC